MNSSHAVQILPPEWFTLPTCVVASDMVGKLLCRTMSDADGNLYTVKIRVVETEAYIGLDDPACHTHAGTRTKRTEVMYEAGGIFYIYLTYGVHHMLNVVTSRAESPESVLIRAGFFDECIVSNAILKNNQPELVASMTHHKNLAGPGKLTNRLNITRDLNQLPVAPDTGLWFEDDGCSPPVQLRPRIGIDYAGDAKDWLLRYVWAGHKSLSKLSCHNH